MAAKSGANFKPRRFGCSAPQSQFPVRPPVCLTEGYGLGASGFDVPEPGSGVGLAGAALGVADFLSSPGLAALAAVDGALFCGWSGVFGCAGLGWACGWPWAGVFACVCGCAGAAGWGWLWRLVRRFPGP